MKHITITCLIICIFTRCNTDPLAKFSYQINGTSIKGRPIVGTGFFIKKNNSTYFLTANHIACGCAENNKKSDGYEKEISIKIKGASKPLIINTMAIRDTCRCDVADFSIQKVDNYFSSYIHAIEQLIAPTTQYDEGDLFIYGYHPIDDDHYIDVPVKALNLTQANTVS